MVRGIRLRWLLALALILMLSALALPTGGAAAGTTYYVGTLADDAGTNTVHCATSTNTDCTFRDAVNATASGSDTVQFKAGLSGTINIFWSSFYTVGISGLTFENGGQHHDQ